MAEQISKKEAKKSFRGLLRGVLDRPDLVLVDFQFNIENEVKGVTPTVTEGVQQGEQPPKAKQLSLGKRVVVTLKLEFERKRVRKAKEK